MLCLNLIPIEVTDRRRRLFGRFEAGRISGFMVRTELVSLSALSAEARPHVEGSPDRDMLDEPTQHGHMETCLASLYHFGSGLGFSSSTKTGALVNRRLDRHWNLVSMCLSVVALEPTIGKRLVRIPWG